MLDPKSIIGSGQLFGISERLHLLFVHFFGRHQLGAFTDDRINSRYTTPRALLYDPEDLKQWLINFIEMAGRPHFVYALHGYQNVELIS